MARAPKRPAADADRTDREYPFRETLSQSHRLDARSCQACHRRKVRCDRGVPCNHCSRHGMDCVYPTKEPDVAQKNITLRDISKRLDRLEILISRIVDGTEASVRNVASGGDDCRGEQIQAEPVANPSQCQSHDSSTWKILLNDERAIQYAINERFISLLQDEERSKNSQSIGLKTPVSHISSSISAHHGLPTQSPACAPRETVSEVLGLYPDTQLALQLWNVYVKSVDPVVKVLHIPTVQSAVVATILDPRSAQSSTLALTFAIYYAAVTALCYDDNSKEDFGLPWEKSVLLERYKTALNRLLIRPDLLNGPQLADLQALAIYVTCLRAHELGRRVWVLHGLAIRLAQSIGLHRDGASLNLSFFETEMRLRLWWHLCVLDSRSIEDQGFQPTVNLMNPELRLPLNVNDDQIYPDMTHLPAKSNSWTDMSFFLIQTESCRVIHPILDTQEESADALRDIRGKREKIQDPCQYMSAKYSISPDSETPNNLPRIATQHVTTACKKMQFVLQLREEIHMRKQNETQDDVTPDVLKRSFELACETLASSHVLLNEGLASNFKWFFNMYTQWYALTYVLRCLCSSTRGFETERAWALVTDLFPRRMSPQGHSEGFHDDDDDDDDDDDNDDNGHNSIWKYLNLLRRQALWLREHVQPSTAIADAGIWPTGSERHTSQLLPDTATITPATEHGAYTLPDMGQDATADLYQSLSSSLDLLMPDIQFLPDWNAVINGQ